MEDALTPLYNQIKRLTFALFSGDRKTTQKPQDIKTGKNPNQKTQETERTLQHMKAVLDGVEIKLMEIQRLLATSMNDPKVRNEFCLKKQHLKEILRNELILLSDLDASPRFFEAYKADFEGDPLGLRLGA